MKSLKIFFLTALVAVAGLFTACTEDHDWSAGEQVTGAQVYFADGVETNVTVEAETSSFEVTVMRGNVDEATTVPLKVAVSAAKVDEEADPINYAELFTVPSNVSFGAGKDSAKFTVSFDRASLEDGQTYTLTFSINDMGAITPYGYDKQTWTLVVPEPMVLLGTGYWTDGIEAAMFGIDTPTYPVEVYENLKNPGWLYLKDLYTFAYVDALINNWGMSEEDVEELKATWEADTYVLINIADPTQVYIPYQEVGNVIGNGPTQIGSAKDVYGTLENGIITFPVKGLAWADEYNGGPYASNPDGATKLYMPGTPMTDFSMELAYGGFRVAEDNETVYPIARAAYGEDVAEIQYAFVAGDITKDAEALNAALNGIEDGSVVSNKVAVTIAGEDEETGEPILEMNLESVEGVEPGMFTVIAIPYSADGEAQYGDLAFTSFYVQGVGAGELPEVEFALYTMSLEDLEEATGDTEWIGSLKEEYGLNSSNSVGAILEGVDIKSINVMTTLSSNIEPIKESFGSVEEYIAALIANGYDLSYNLEYIEKYGWDYNVFGGNYAPETSYTMFALVENTFGNVQLFSSSFTTEAAEATAKMGSANLRPAVMKGVSLHKELSSIDSILYNVK
ncbi:MAG: DUF1735 domain-containing protein [Alistipes sp.]|nr:DUF1735 domain-containing protein [Alistipes sp.]